MLGADAKGKETFVSIAGQGSDRGERPIVRRGVGCGQQAGITLSDRTGEASGFARSPVLLHLIFQEYHAAGIGHMADKLQSPPYRR